MRAVLQLDVDRALVGHRLVADAHVGDRAIEVFTEISCLRTSASFASCCSKTELNSFSRQSGGRESENVRIAATAFAVDGYTLTVLVMFDCSWSKFGDLTRGFFLFALLNATNGAARIDLLRGGRSSAASDV